MPLIVPGSLQLGPRSPAAPTTLIEYLASINKTSFYARWGASFGRAAQADGSGGPVPSGGAVGCWAPIQQSNFPYKFVQVTTASRPAYSETLSSLGPVISGNGLSWVMSLDSATALDRDCTILASVETTVTLGYIFSQNGDQWSWYSPPNQPPLFYYGTTELGTGLLQAHRSETPPGAASWQRLRRIAVSSGPQNSRYGSALRILGGNGAYFSATRIAELAIVPRLTAAECGQALQFLV